MIIAIKNANKALEGKAKEAMPGRVQSYYSSERDSYFLEFQSSAVSFNVVGGTVFIFDYASGCQFTFNREDFTTIEII